MVDVVVIASYISERYQKEYGERIDEMKLHKLLYFTQRECITQQESRCSMSHFQLGNMGR